MADLELTIGDILKSEADPNNRVAVPALVGTKAGDLVKFELRDEYLIALTDESYGDVLVQPHNCVIYLDNIKQTVLDGKFSDDLNTEALTVTDLIAQGDAHGIKYIGTLRA